VASEKAEMIGARLGAADERVAARSARLEQAGFTAAVDQAEANRLDRAARDLAAQAGTLASVAGKLADLQAALEALDPALAGAGKHLAELTEPPEAARAQPPGP